MSFRPSVRLALAALVSLSALCACTGPTVPPALAASATQAVATRSEVQAAPLMVIGGGKDQDDIMKQFLQLAGASRPIVVVPLASNDPPKSGRAYVEYLNDLGHAQVHFVVPSGDPTAEDRKLLAEAGGFFFSGGDQTRILKAMGPAWQKDLRAAWQRGAVMAGTSAGAMVWGSTAILDGDPMQTGWHGEDPDYPGIRLGAGFGLMPQLVVDTHFSERGRLPRLAYAAAKRPGTLGVGVDPQTAAVLHPGGRLEVIGRGTVTVVEVPPQPLKAPLSLKNMKVHLLSSGDQLSLEGR